MKIKFEEMVVNLAKDGGELIEGLTPKSAHILHMAVGVGTEIGELIENFLLSGTHENRVEEFGDIEFYFEGIAGQIKLNPSIIIKCDVVPFITSEQFLRLSMNGAALLDAAKKYSIYEKPLDLAEVTKQLCAIRKSLCNLYFIYKITRQEAITANIAKLGVRYESGLYSNNQAITRADKSDLT